MLKEKLSELKTGAAEKIPPETLATMMDCRRQLEQSGIFEQVVQPGTPLPGFELADATGNKCTLAELHQDGPLLINLYRGVW